MDVPDQMLAQNPYFAAFTNGRRAQMGIDPEKLGKALAGVTAESLRRAAEQVFARDRRAAVVVRETGADSREPEGGQDSDA